jgi:hypothetical protein
MSIIHFDHTYPPIPSPFFPVLLVPPQQFHINTRKKKVKRYHLGSREMIPNGNKYHKKKLRT